jgi:BlaI family penicillinase repressor
LTARCAKGSASKRCISSLDEEEGRGHRYHAAIEQQAARKRALRHLTSKLFKGSTELLFAHLVADRKLGADDIARMRTLLASADKEGK